MSASILALGADPGRHGGLALVQMCRGELPELLGVWRFQGEGMDGYFDRATQAALDAQELRAGRPVKAWIEEVPPFGRAQVAAGLGRRQGLLIASLLVASFPDPERVLPLVWPQQWGGRIRSGKDKEDKGLHRLDEVGRLFQPGARELLDRLGGASVIVDAAEAVLIAGAACIAGLGEEAQTKLLLEVKSQPKKKRGK